MGLKVIQSLDVYISLSLLPSSFAFVSNFFSLTGHLVDFISVGKVFGKTFRIFSRIRKKKR